MPYLFLFGSMCSSGALSVLGTSFNRKNSARRQVSTLYNLLIACSVLVSWLILYAFDFSFDFGVLPYSVGFAFFYTLAMIGHIQALKSGSVSLTAFIKQLSLVFVSLWGFVFWDSPITANVGIGLVLITVALALCFLGKKRDGRQGAVISMKWVGYAAILLIGNAGCSIIQKYQQLAFNGAHRSMLMVFASLCSVIFCLVLGRKEDKGDWTATVRDSWYFPVGAGVASALLNLFVLRMASTTLSPSIIYPGIAVGGVTLTSLASVVLFKERLLWRQWVGLAIGVIALVFLNL